MASPARLFSSSVGLKLLIGVTGLGLVIYLIVHIAGNLMVFFGPEVFNWYAFTLSSNPLIPIIEIGLLLIFLVHVYKTVGMYLANQSARPVHYERRRPAGPPSRKSLASTTMILSGLWLVVFIVIHVRTFRFGVEYDWPAGGHDLYRVEMETFANPLTVAFYVVSMLVVGSHLWHGVSSSLQSLGLDDPTWTPRVRVAGKGFAVLIAGGFIVIALWAHFVGGRP
jgi:succinate dehydrogenase / fumarate reductase cytochrome b subunit